MALRPAVAIAQSCLNPLKMTCKSARAVGWIRKTMMILTRRRVPKSGVDL